MISAEMRFLSSIHYVPLRFTVRFAAKLGRLHFALFSARGSTTVPTQFQLNWGRTVHDTISLFTVAESAAVPTYREDQEILLWWS